MDKKGVAPIIIIGIVIIGFLVVGGIATGVYFVVSGLSKTKDVTAVQDAREAFDEFNYEDFDYQDLGDPSQHQVSPEITSTPTSKFACENLPLDMIGSFTGREIINVVPVEVPGLISCNLHVEGVSSSFLTIDARSMAASVSYSMEREEYLDYEGFRDISGVGQSAFIIDWPEIHVLNEGIYYVISAYAHNILSEDQIIELAKEIL